MLAVEAFVGSWFGAQSAVYDGQLIAFVGQMECGSVLDKYMTERLMYLVAPFTDFGPAPVVYFNMFVVLAFVGLHTVVTVLHMKKRDIPFNDTRANRRRA